MDLTAEQQCGRQAFLTLSEATSESRMILRVLTPGRPAASRLGRRGLLQVAVVEHAVLGEVLGGTHRSGTLEQLVDRGHGAPPAGVVSAVSGRDVTSKVDCIV